MIRDNVAALITFAEDFVKSIAGGSYHLIQ